MRNYLELGKWNVICDRCGFAHKNTDLRKEWTGLMVCTQCYEPRHPQDLIRVRTERGGVPWSRPEPPDQFISDPILAETSDFLQTETGATLLAET